MKFKIIPLSLGFVEKVKTEKIDSFGNPVIRQLATGHGPCRLSLRPFVPGEDYRLLFSHSPFKKRNAFDQSGPIFIQDKEVAAYSDVHNFPKEIKADSINFPLSLIGYNENQEMVSTQLVGDKDIDELINEVFETNFEIDFLHARNAEACCFICKIERC